MSMIFYSQNYHSCFLLLNNYLFPESLFNNHIYRTLFIRSCLLMKQIYLTLQLTIEAQPVLSSYSDLNTPNIVLPKIQRELTPNGELFNKDNRNYEAKLVMVENTLIDYRTSHQDADASIIGKVFNRYYHAVDTVLRDT